ncbi:NAD(P)-dependent oxidoreductase [Pseudomonas sp. MN1F]|uniref:NAD-dependent epimerase/dehydratase family protein n=1 Tax=Pseudomonas sp. MN1F TaxID=1366632 RepID=UPI00128F240D|nr:NAD-dependent epimerase/dehydratase family protein [Pseudomonas sp. MN1F]MQG92028.1 NAD-dependent epimerase/dehydratase family protein [Pseudomonas sp. MN1F]
MHIIVTGALGFIGVTYVRKLLCNPNVFVSAVDDQSAAALLPEEALQYWSSSDRVKLFIQDAGNFLVNYQGKFDLLVHLASVVGPVGVIGHVGNILAETVRLTQAAIRATLVAKARLLYVSTSEVYGEGNADSCSVNRSCVFAPENSARQEYAISKLACEIQIRNLCGATGLDAVIIRPFNVAGPYQSARGGFVLPRFLDQAMSNSSLTVYGDGSQVRAFMHVDDFVEACMTISDIGGIGKVYNVGNPYNRTSIGALAQAVIKATGSASQIAYVNPQSLHGNGFVEAPNKSPFEVKILSFCWKERRTLSEIITDTYSARCQRRDIPSITKDNSSLLHASTTDQKSGTA